MNQISCESWYRHDENFRRFARIINMTNIIPRSLRRTRRRKRHVGRIFLSPVAPQDRPWMGQAATKGRSRAVHGFEATRETTI
jgi:hypothetical protein